MAALKRNVRVEFGKIPEVMVQKFIMNMKKRGTSWLACPPSST